MSVQTFVMLTAFKKEFEMCLFSESVSYSGAEWIKETLIMKEMCIALYLECLWVTYLLYIVFSHSLKEMTLALSIILCRWPPYVILFRKKYLYTLQYNAG